MNKKTLLLLLSLVIGSVLYAQTPASQPIAGTVIQMDKALFQEKIFDYSNKQATWKYKGNKPAIIDFYADWCGPCRKIAPILKELAKEYADELVIYKVDTDKQKELGAEMGIQSLPTILFIPVDGQPQLMVGAADKDTFVKAIEEVLLKK
ncbi:MAG: thioredoxin [Phocaeicola sp.]